VAIPLALPLHQGSSTYAFQRAAPGGRENPAGVIYVLDTIYIIMYK